MVSVVVVTAASGNYLTDCLNSLQAQVSLPAEIVVIDNSLQPEFTRRVSRDFPRVKFFPSPFNLYYAQGMNKGIELTKGEFVLCLNDDVVLDKMFIAEALKGFLIDPRIGAVSGKILRSDGTTLDSTGLFLSPFRTARERGYGRKDCGQYEKDGYIFGASGAAAFYRRKMLEEIKKSGDYFDARFRMFYEDLDLAWRAQRKNWRAYYIPTALAYHARGGTARLGGGIGKPRARKYLSRPLHLDLVKNRYLAMRKNETLSGLLAHLPAIILYDFLAWAFILFFDRGFLAFSVGELRKSRPAKN
ncbi:MAG: glycosyltransferase family 2 protein [Candidatus Omnitrophota bacterium]|nr:glycosyltransferase family 2 protein [Candidatus Omnitrophota bacterium]